jgi:hypothetical protein
MAHAMRANHEQHIFILKQILYYAAIEFVIICN